MKILTRLSKISRRPSFRKQRPNDGDVAGGRNSDNRTMRSIKVRLRTTLNIQPLAHVAANLPSARADDWQL